MDILPSDFYVGDVYLDTQPIYRQWIAGEALRLCNASFWSQRGANPTQADDIEQTFIEIVRRILENTMPIPIGQIITTISLLDSADWLLLDGSTYPIASYPELASVLPEHWKLGANFSVMNMSKFFAVGAVYDGDPDIASYGIGRIAGEERVTLGLNEMPSHTHGSINNTQFISTVVTAGTGSNALASGTTLTGRSNTASTGGGESHNNMPPSLAVYYYIRAR